MNEYFWKFNIQENNIAENVVVSRHELPNLSIYILYTFSNLREHVIAIRRNDF